MTTDTDRQPIDIERMNLAHDLTGRVTTAAADATDGLQNLLDVAAQFSTKHHQALLDPVNAFAAAVEAMIPDLEATLLFPGDWDPSH